MNKCPKCGQVFDGNFCPKCGSPALIEKFCPKCGIKLDGAETICHQCGYSFLAPPQPIHFYQPVPVQAVTKKSGLKKAIIIIVALLLVLTTLILVFTLVDIKNNGTYYAVQNGEVNRKSFITIKNGDWSDEDGNGGEYKKSNGKLTFYIDFFGETMEYATGEVNDGMLTIDMGGFDAVYISKKHNHNYQLTKTTLATCTIDGFEIRECKCGCINQITTAPKLSHEAQGGWYFDGTSHWQICRRCNNIINEAEHDDEDNCTICGYPLTYSLNSDETAYTVTGHSLTDENFKTEITIPSTYNGKPVTSIGDFAFSDCTFLVNLNIPDSITEIGWCAFKNCSSLTRVTIPDSVIKIDPEAFSGCGRLTNVTIGNSVTSISWDAFKNCTSLTSVTIGNGVTSIDNSAFQYCTRLVDLTIPDGVTTIGERAFFRCVSLESITIPDSVTFIGSDAFLDCSSLTNVYYTGDIGGWCGISGLSNLMTDGRTVYVDGKELAGDIVIPDGATLIGERAFYYCSSLTSITIPDSVTSIGSDAFGGCSSLTNVYYTGGIGGWCGISGLSNLMKDSRTVYVDGKELAGDIVIPDSATLIGERAFYYCSSLTSINIPNSVTSIDSWAFYYCYSLTSVTIGNSVTSIGSEAFYNCRSLTSVTIGNSVTSIGREAFYNCRSLTSITIPDSVTSIGSSAFEDCSSLTSITIPDSVTSIGSYAFYGCRSLTDIIYNGTKGQWNAISKGHYWNNSTGNYTVHCTDGDIAKQ